MSDKNGKNFTFDPEQDGNEVPTLTSLLYRKKAVKSAPSSRSAAPANALSLEPTSQIEIGTQANGAHIVSSNFAGSGMSDNGVSSDVKNPFAIALEPVEPVLESAPAESFSATPIDAISIFGDDPSAGMPSEAPAPVLAITPQSPSAPESGDAADRGLAVLQKKNLLRGAVILSPVPGGAKRFGYSRQVGKPESASLWEGVGMEIGDFGDLFARLGKFGFVEFSPLAVNGAANSDRIGFRTAFGIEDREWLTLVRIGTSTTPDSVVLVISEGSIQSQLPLFHTAVSRAA